MPVGLKQLIELQLGQLDAEEQQVLEVASVVGAEFAEASVAAGLPLPLDAIAARCEGLAQRGQFIEDRGLAAWPDGTVSGRYGFRHALYQEVLYGRLGSGRRMRYHRAIGTRLEAAYGAQEAQIAATLAVHFERGHDPARAVRYLEQAAENAAQRHAHHEVTALLTKALELLATLPETPARAQQELHLQLALGRLDGHQGPGGPEVEQTYARVRALCAQVGETPQLCRCCGASWFHGNRGALSDSAGDGGTARAAGAARGRPTDLLEAHSALGKTLFYLGDYGAAGPPASGARASTWRRSATWRCAMAWRRGCGAWALAPHAVVFRLPGAGPRRGQEALALALALAHPYSLAFVRITVRPPCITAAARCGRPRRTPRRS